MLLKLIRLDATDQGIFGKLETEGFSCVTLERHDIAIPVGHYSMCLYSSPTHGVVPLLRNVPGRTMIEIHAGNWEHQSLGCILVGKTRTILEGKQAIGESKSTLKQLVKLLQASPEALSIEIS